MILLILFGILIICLIYSIATDTSSGEIPGMTVTPVSLIFLVMLFLLISTTDANTKFETQYRIDKTSDLTKTIIIERTSYKNNWILIDPTVLLIKTKIEGVE